MRDRRQQVQSIMTSANNVLAKFKSDIVSDDEEDVQSTSVSAMRMPQKVRAKWIVVLK